MDHDAKQYLPDLLALEREELLNFSGCSILLVSRKRGAEDIAGVLEHVRTRPESYCVMSDLHSVLEIFYTQQAKDILRWNGSQVVWTDGSEAICSSDVVFVLSEVLEWCSLLNRIFCTAWCVACALCDGRWMKSASSYSTMNNDLMQLKVELPEFISVSIKDKPCSVGVHLLAPRSPRTENHTYIQTIVHHFTHFNKKKKSLM